MKVLAEKVYDGLSEAIEELEKDVELNPRRFLGIALYPENLWSSFVASATIAFGLFQNRIFPDD